MNNLILKTMLIVLTTVSAMTKAEPAQDKGTLARLRDRLEQDMAKWTVTTDDAIEQAKNAIQAAFGFQVSCDRGWYGLWGSLSVENCAIGLSRLNAALSQITPPVPRDETKTISIEIGRPGLWQGLTFQGHELIIPYNSAAPNMARFLTNELRLAYSTNLADLLAANRRSAERIKDRYFVKVESAPDLDPYQVHDGLKKVELAMILVYGGKKPTEATFRKLGLDTLVLDTRSSRVFENSGDLRMSIDITKHPGEIFRKIIASVELPESPWMRRPTQLVSWTWNDVINFRDNRKNVEQISQSLQSKLGLKSLNCALESSQPGHLNLANCRAGLETLQRVVASADPSQLRHLRGLNGLVIKDLALMRNYTYDRGQNQLDIDYKASPEKVAEALTQHDEDN